MKEFSPIYTTPSGKVILLMDLQIKEWGPINLTGTPSIFSGIIISLLVPRYLTMVPVFLSKSNSDEGV